MHARGKHARGKYARGTHARGNYERGKNSRGTIKVGYNVAASHSDTCCTVHLAYSNVARETLQHAARHSD